jgi:hypothetical protein
MLDAPMRCLRLAQLAGAVFDLIQTRETERPRNPLGPFQGLGSDGARARRPLADPSVAALPSLR